MDTTHEWGGTSFIWDHEKSIANREKHGVTFEEAVTVFGDPLIRIVNASRNDEARDAAIGFDKIGRLLFVVHIEFEDEAIRIISARRATAKDEQSYDQ